MREKNRRTRIEDITGQAVLRAVTNRTECFGIGKIMSLSIFLGNSYVHITADYDGYLRLDEELSLEQKLDIGLITTHEYESEHRLNEQYKAGELIERELQELARLKEKFNDY
jgi:hypothetical protein